MKRSACFILAVLTLLAVGVPNAFAWGNAVHAWLADNLGAKAGNSNFQEIYGAILPDQYNFLFDETGQFMAFQAHDNFLPVVDSASTCREKAAAFGFAMHNDLWGADSTAHVSGRTTPGVGYVVLKGAQLAPEFTPELADLFVQAGLPPDQALYLAGALAPQFGHVLVEYAVDLKIKREYERSIGAKMASAALVRSNDIPGLMAAAYADILAAYSGMSVEESSAYLTAAEEAFVPYLVGYGKAFCGSGRKALRYMAWEGAVSGSGFIKAVTGLDIVIPPELVARFIVRAGELVTQPPEYSAELGATLTYLREQMAASGIESCAPAGVGR